MSFIDRVLGRETKTSAAKRLIALSLGSRAAWTPRDYAALAREGFTRNPVAHRCVRMIAEAAAAAPLQVLRGGQVREGDPAAAMLAQPNPDQSGAELLEDHYGYLQVAGNAYLELAALDGAPRELFALRPDRMRVLPATGRAGRARSCIHACFTRQTTITACRRWKRPPLPSMFTMRAARGLKPCWTMRRGPPGRWS